MIVARDKRITAKHIRELAEADVKTFSVNEEFILGRVLAEDVVDKVDRRSGGARQ